MAFSVSSWRAVLRASDGDFSESLNQGGFDTIKSYFESARRFLTQPGIARSLSLHGDAAKFSAACSHAARSISIASTTA